MTIVEEENAVPRLVVVYKLVERLRLPHISGDCSVERDVRVAVCGRTSEDDEAD